MYKNGFQFLITDNEIIGTVNGSARYDYFGRETIYSVTFNDHGYIYRYDIFESTITNNLKCGNYKAM